MNRWVAGEHWPAGELWDRVTELCYEPFDLAAGPPARAHLIQVDETTTLLVLIVHHIVFDGWSRRLLVTEIAEIYRAVVAGREPALTEPPHPASVAAGTSPDDLPSRIADVVGRLRDAPVGIRLPYDRLPADDQALTGEVSAIRFDGDLTDQVLAAATAEGCTAFMAAVAVLTATLARTSEQRDFLLAVVWPGREDPASHDVVGMLMNTVVLRIRLDERTTWRELLRAARTSALEAFIDADVPFSAVAAELDSEREVGRPPLTPILVNLADAPASVELAPGVRGKYRQPDVLFSIWDLIVFVNVDEEPGRRQLEISLDYSAKLFDSGTIASLLTAMQTNAANLIDSPEEPVLDSTSSALDLADPVVRAQVVRTAWQEILETEDFDDDTGFFEAGGDSLLLVALVEELSKVSGRSLKTMAVFRAGSVKGQAELLAPESATVPEAAK